VSELEHCDCLMCLAEGDNSPHRRRQAAAKAFKAVSEEALNGRIPQGQGDEGCPPQVAGSRQPNRRAAGSHIAALRPLWVLVV
jgi:hypothetical protein